MLKVNLPCGAWTRLNYRRGMSSRRDAHQNRSPSRHSACRKGRLFCPRLLLLVMLMAVTGCGYSEMETTPAYLRVACENGDKSACASYTKAVEACEARSSLMVLVETRSVKNCEGKN